MTEQPSAAAVAILWRILLKGGAVAQKDIRPTVDAKVRQQLESRGLLRTRKVGRGNVLEVTDRGWDWAESTLLAGGTDLGTNAIRLDDVMACLRGFLQASRTRLAEVLRPPASSPLPDTTAEAPPAAAASGGLEERIRSAYLAMTQGAFSRRARLATLRERLADVPRADLDATLIDLAGSGRATLMRFDDPREITGADEAAALRIGGAVRHLLWIDR